jgi:hypothetical protein
MLEKEYISALSEMSPTILLIGLDRWNNGDLVLFNRKTKTICKTKRYEPEDCFLFQMERLPNFHHISFPFVIAK